ncbi:MAG: class I SAM-dependent methyltransferase [Longimonas sp.]|uniref:class I SAM-dependent methyltransferase n=1 Tax=Longimonas sp. TaxID=2039626 RepID=UPI0033620C54
MSLSSYLFARGLHSIDTVQHRVYADRKTHLLSGLHGTVVEIGPGTGLNLAYLKRDITYIGLEPNPHLHMAIRTQMHTQGISGRVLERPVEANALPPRSADVVISTLVLCSVPDVQAALASIRRLLRPSGRFIFIEHIADTPGSCHHALQEGITPFWKRCFDGCHPNRRTDHAISQAGFKRVKQDHFTVDVPIVRPHCAGYAIA